MRIIRIARAAALAAVMALGMVGVGAIPADAISSCSISNYKSSTRTKCTSTAGSGNVQRAGQFCTNGTNGAYQYGGWKQAGYTSIAQVCYATITKSGIQKGIL